MLDKRLSAVLIGGAVLVLSSTVTIMDWRKLLFWEEPKEQRQQLATFDPANLEADDEMAIRQLEIAGADLSKPREVLHYLYLPTAGAARRVAEELRSQGFTAEERPAATADENTPNPWLVLATTHMIVSNETVRETRRRFEKLANEARGEYDGWEAATKP